MAEPGSVSGCRWKGRDRRWPRWLVLALVLKCAAMAAGQSGAERTLRPGPANATGDVVPGRYYALVIGIGAYPAPVPKLTNPVSDAMAIGTVLEREYGFQVQYLLDGDATRNSILKALTGYRNHLLANDSLLIYYAGHGDRDSGGEGRAAYWIPVDADGKESPNSISRSDLAGRVGEMLTQHVLVISDSCFAGDLVRSIDRVDDATDVTLAQRMLRYTSRHVMTSGNDEPVLDSGGSGHSVFAKELLDGLETEPLAMFTGEQLFVEKIQGRVVSKADQTPVYALLPGAGDDGGDFVFVRKVGAPEAASRVSAPVRDPAAPMGAVTAAAADGSARRPETAAAVTNGRSVESGSGASGNTTSVPPAADVSSPSTEVGGLEPFRDANGHFDQWLAHAAVVHTAGCAGASPGPGSIPETDQQMIAFATNLRLPPDCKGNLRNLPLSDKLSILDQGLPPDAVVMDAAMEFAPLEISGIVIEANARQVQIAVMPEAQRLHYADFTVDMTKKLKQLPAIGSRSTYTGTFAGKWGNQDHSVWSLGNGVPKVVASPEASAAPAAAPSDQSGLAQAALSTLVSAVAAPDVARAERQKLADQAMDETPGCAGITPPVDWGDSAVIACLENLRKLPPEQLGLLLRDGRAMFGVQAIERSPFEISGIVTSANAHTVKIALSREAQQKNITEVIVKMKTGLKQTPSRGTRITYLAEYVSAEFDTRNPEIGDAPKVTLQNGAAA